jgi:hypothetical protein
MENPNFSQIMVIGYFRLFLAIFCDFHIFNSTRVNYVLGVKFYCREFEFLVKFGHRPIFRLFFVGFQCFRVSGVKCKMKAMTQD